MSTRGMGGTFTYTQKREDEMPCSHSIPWGHWVPDTLITYGLHHSQLPQYCIRNLLDRRSA